MRPLLLLLLCPVLAAAQFDPAFVVKSNLSYNKLESSGDGLFGFEKDDKFGYMDKTEKVIIPAIYSYESTSYKTIAPFSKGYAIIKKDGKYGMIDKTGKVTVPFEYENLYHVYTYPQHVKVSRKVGSRILYGIVNTQNKVIIPLEYDDVITDSSFTAVKQDNKWGLMDHTGKKILPNEYSYLTSYTKEKVLRAEKDGKYGYIDMTGKWLFDKSKSVFILYGASNGMILCSISGKYGFLNLSGDEVIITKYDYAFDFEPIGLAKVSRKSSAGSYTSLYGYIDKTGNEVIPVKYETIGVFRQGLVYVKDPETNRYGYMDKTGKWAIKPVYLEAQQFDETGGAWVKMTDGKYHYINKAGKDLGSFEGSYKAFNKEGYAVYEHADYPYVLVDKNGKTIKKIDDGDGIYNFSEGIGGYKCKTSSKYGFIDVNGNILTPCNFSGFAAFSEGVSRVETLVAGKTKYGYINTRGETIVPIDFDYLTSMKDGWGVVKKDGNHFFIDRNGNQKEAPRKYDNLIEFKSGYAVGSVKNSDNTSTYYYINSQLKEEFNLTAMQAYQFWDDVAVVNRNSVYELMNKKGEVFKSLENIDQIKFSTDGMLAVKEKNGKWGYMDNKGNIAIPAKYDSCDHFKYGYGRFKQGSKWGLVDKTGKEVVEAKYDNILPGENGLFIFFDKYWGIMDKTGKILIGPTFYSMTAFERDRALARLGKSYTIIRSPLAK